MRLLVQNNSGDAKVVTGKKRTIFRRGTDSGIREISQRSGEGEFRKVTAGREEDGLPTLSELYISRE